MLWLIISWILIGFVVGWLAKLICPKRMPSGFWRTTLIGVAGSLVGGVLSNLLGLGQSGASPGNFSFWSILIAVGGAIVVILIYNSIKKR